MRPNPGFGLYIHFPWCLSKCGYCDFYSVAVSASDSIDHEGYASAVLAELEQRLSRTALPRTPLPRLTTLYLGGGTPSLWRAQAIKRVLDHILERFETDSHSVEITAECNPSSFDAKVADGLQAAGVNRISLGIQSLDDEQLRFLGRRHDRQLALDALETALHCGIGRISADVLFGLPRQTLADELAQIVQVAGLPLSHVSAYALTIEEGTPFGRLAQRGRLPIAVEERVADAFLAVHAELERLGYEHYEISNFAKPGERSLHNQQYWWGYPYLGLGAGAVGTIPVAGQWLRYRNPPNAREYLARFGREGIGSGSVWDGDDQVEILDADTRFRERLMLGLRLREGVDLQAIGHELDVDPWTPERQRVLTRLAQNKRITLDGTRCYIDSDAWLLADGTIAQLM
ncbi:MAG TPA: radical SAM family heme chaperone HemW [Polyangiaceae bacterium]|nr:radical SAM family heme chaperone HemW [Polyangiaceae bacterium]